MSTDTAHDVVSKDHAENHAENHGMSNAGYIRIAAILAAITALEVSTVYIDFGPFFDHDGGQIYYGCKLFHALKV